MQARFDVLSYTRRAEYARSIESAKAPETRARRLAKAIAELSALSGDEHAAEARHDIVNGVFSNSETVRLGRRPRAGDRAASGRATAILAAAGELMLEGGMAATTMEAIASRAGVSKATIYKWWPSRGAVALDGFLNQVQDTVGRSGRCVRRRGAMRIQLRALIAIFRDTSAGPLMRALVAQAVAEPDIAEALREHWLGPRRAVAVVRAPTGSPAASSSPDTDVAAAADQLFGPIYHRLFFGHDPLDERLADALVDQLMRGIAAPAHLSRKASA